MRQDATFKDIFAFPFMVEELVRWFVGDLHDGGELVDGLDFSGLERAHEQSTTGPADAKRRYANDIVWRIPFHARARAIRSWLHLLLMIEPQREVDYLMALRVRNYVDNHHLELWRGQRFGAAARLAPVLPVVIYTGRPRWTAATRVIDLVTPATAHDPEPDVASRRSGLFAGDGYLTLDTLRLATEDLRHDNAAALLAGLCNPSVERLPAQAAALCARLHAPPLRPLLEVVLAWAQHTARQTIGFDLGVDDMAQVDRLQESGDLEAYFAERRRAYEEKYRKEGLELGIAQGLEQGLERGLEQGLERGLEQGLERGLEQGLEQGIAQGEARGERKLLYRQASRKFGADAGERLTPLLEDIGSTDLLATVGEWILDCETLEELLDRLDAVGAGEAR